MDSEKRIAEQEQYLTFLIAQEEFAVRVLRVKEIIQCDTVTVVPKTPPWIRGVINLRGSVVPVVDLAVKFGQTESEVTSSTCIIIIEVDLEGEHSVMGILADAVSQVVKLRPEDIEMPPAFGTRIHVDYLLGMGKAGKKFILVLDVDAVLSANELLAAAEVAGAGDGSSAEGTDSQAAAASAEPEAEGARVEAGA